jgi:hypothetical protein
MLSSFTEASLDSNNRTMRVPWLYLSEDTMIFTVFNDLNSLKSLRLLQIRSRSWDTNYRPPAMVTEKYSVNLVSSNIGSGYAVPSSVLASKIPRVLYHLCNIENCGDIRLHDHLASFTSESEDIVWGAWRDDLYARTKEFLKSILHTQSPYPVQCPKPSLTFEAFTARVCWLLRYSIAPSQASRAKTKTWSRFRLWTRTPREHKDRVL